ncbi:methyl-accepting chemotaxis protein [Azospirillum fermentarium]|uniref:methyl-accepting chemotaxis protein n=1 Tax=Azospirillum fermentarium TaxID=1233114 RepID=UPI002227B0C8|nr:methyl-accepting chemotaxis protein [Azospirillum fermentarium]MCW2246557.1 methyl-accepting chemotaxis protein [Azospirillum fermentarium]
MQESGLAGRFKVGTRIYFGFAVILALLILGSVSGISGLVSARTGFGTYATVSNHSLLVLDINANVAQMRRIAVNYINSGDEAIATQVRSIQEALGKDLREAVGTASDQTRPALTQMTSLFDTYQAGFGKLVELRRQRDTLVREQLIPLGDKAQQALADIHASAMRDGDTAAAGQLGPVIERLMAARLEAQRFLGAPDEATAGRTRTANQQFLSLAEGFAASLTDPTRRRLAQASVDAATQYLAGFNQVAAAVLENTATVARLAGMGAEFADLAEKTVDTEGRNRDQLLAATTAQMENTQAQNIAIAAAALVIGILFAWLVARSIVRPVTDMTDTMTHLAGGQLDVTIPALANQDEIGSMAKAVQVFKDNAIEKKRMDEAERARIEQERREDEAQRAREQAIGQEIAALIDSVSKGDLSRRIDLNGKDGFYRTMSEGINRLTDTVKAVIDDLGRVLGALAEGDLNSRIDKDYQGAFQALKTNVNTTSSKLGEIVGQILRATDAITSAASEVSMGSSDLAERTEQQASSLEETAASMEELGATVRSNADNAQRANRMASDARTAAESGGQVATSAVEAMRQIENASRKITDIIGVIDEIAFQTNLLALNAAVEAARAGDAGRGFAVVAQEVRNLAQRSAQASKEIKSLIMDSDSQVRGGVELVQKAGAALEGIVGGVHEVASLIAEMASASAEQASALDEINSAVAQMDEMTQKNAALVEETTAAAHSLAGQAGDLRSLVGFFRLDGANRAPTVVTPALHTAPSSGGGAPAAVKRHIAPTRPAARKPAAPAKAAAPARAATAAALSHANTDEDDWKEF